MNRKERNLPAVIGGSSLLVIFAVLCLVVFAILSLSTARANESVSQGAAAAVEGYYQADCRAEEILSQLRAGEIPQGVTEEGDGVYSYTCPISDTHGELSVQVKVSGSDYTVLRWQMIPAENWQADDSLPVWSGE